MFITPSFKNSLIVEQFQGNYLKKVNCKERTTCTNSSEVEPDPCEDQDEQCSITYKSKWKADRTAKVNFNAQYFG